MFYLQEPYEGGIILSLIVQEIGRIDLQICKKKRKLMSVYNMKFWDLRKI